MNLYLAKLVFSINIENEKQTAQFDEQIRIIESNDLEGAFFKPKAIGKQEESSFKNTKNETVNWKFIDVSELYALTNVKDGQQLYSVTHEMDSANAFIEFTRKKAMLIQTNFLTFA
jgi:hypothetical protein